MFKVGIFSSADVKHTLYIEVAGSSCSLLKKINILSTAKWIDIIKRLLRQFYKLREVFIPLLQKLLVRSETVLATILK